MGGEKIWRLSEFVGVQMFSEFWLGWRMGTHSKLQKINHSKVKNGTFILYNT